jgi:hypothetical protein
MCVAAVAGRAALGARDREALVGVLLKFLMFILIGQGFWGLVVFLAMFATVWAWQYRRRCRSRVEG